jgi:hypothetical protein
MFTESNSEYVPLAHEVLKKIMVKEKPGLVNPGLSFCGKSDPEKRHKTLIMNTF